MMLFFIEDCRKRSALNLFEWWLSFAVISLLCMTIVINNLIDYDPILMIAFAFSLYLYWKYRIPIEFSGFTKKIIYLFVAYYSFFLLHILISAVWWGIDERGISLISKAITLFSVFYIFYLIKPNAQFMGFICVLFLATTIFVGAWDLIFQLLVKNRDISQILSQAHIIGFISADRGEYAWIVSSVFLIFLNYLIVNISYIRSDLRLLLSGTIIALLTIIVATGTRSAWLSLVIVGVFLSYWYVFYLKMIAYKWIAIAFILCAVIGVMILQTNNPVTKGVVTLKNDIEMQQEKNFVGSIGQRIVQYKTSLAIIKEHPFWGITDAHYRDYLKNFSEDRRDVISNKILAQNSLQYNHLHNHSLMDFVNRGIIGFILSVLVLVMPLIWFIGLIRKSFLREDRRLLLYSLSGGSMVMLHIVYFQFSAMFYYSHALLFFWLSLLWLAFSIDAFTTENKN